MMNRPMKITMKTRPTAKMTDLTMKDDDSYDEREWKTKMKI